jgi:hypothetical protein
MTKIVIALQVEMTRTYRGKAVEMRAIKSSARRLCSWRATANSLDRVGPDSHRDKPWELMRGVVNCVLAAVSALSILGLRQLPRRFPLLIFELGGKPIWLVVVAIPLLPAHKMHADTWATAAACLTGAIFPIVIPRCPTC